MNRHLTNLSLIGYLFIGTAAVLIPSIMPFITEEFMAAGLTLAAIGLIFPARSAGSILGNILAGIGSDLLGRWRLVWLSVFILAASLALAAVTKLWLLFMIGFVFMCAAFAERTGYAVTLLVMAVGLTLTYPLVVLGNNSILVVAGVFLSGLSFSGLFPMALAYGTRLYPEQTGTVTGTLNVAMTVGAMIPPLWTGIIAESWGMQIALGINYIMVLPMIFLALYLGRVEARHPGAQPATSTM